jgi:hypothetical protein
VRFFRFFFIRNYFPASIFTAFLGAIGPRRDKKEDKRRLSIKILPVKKFLKRGYLGERVRRPRHALELLVLCCKKVENKQ